MRQNPLSEITGTKLTWYKINLTRSMRDRMTTKHVSIHKQALKNCSLQIVHDRSDKPANNLS
jgi:hypothetical protein